MVTKNVSFFLYSDGAKNLINEGGNGLIIENPKITFTLPFIPSAFTFSITIGITGVDVTEEHVFKYQFFDPDRNILIDIKEQPLQRQLPNSEMIQLPKEYRGIILNMEFRNVPLKKEGIYYSVITIDGENLGEFPIYVVGKEKL